MAGGLISVRGAVKHFGEVRAVDGIDLDIERGEIFGLIGHNGAGKSTLFKLMLGLMAPSSGEIRVDGAPVRGAAFREVRRRLGYLPENVVFYDNLTGLETLRFFADLKGAPRGDCAALLEKVGLAQAAQRRVKGYSKGMRQRLGFAQALLGTPALLCLDEPTNGLDPEGIRAFYRTLRELKDRGVTVVLSSHILSEIQERVDRLAIIKTGRIQALGTLQSLREATGLSVRFELRLLGDAEAGVRNALAGLPVEDIQADGARVSVRCRHDAKMAVLAALASLDGRVADIHMREPSLEDVFLGYSG